VYLTQGLHRALQRNPHKTALIHLTETGERGHSHAHLLATVARQACALEQRGIGSGDRVALLAPNTDQLIQGLLACWWAGAVACPLNTRWSDAELAHALDDSQASLLLLDDSRAQAVPQAGTPRLALDEFAREAQALAPLPDRRIGAEALSTLLYTGGTTGRSKGVMLSHANLWSAAITRAAELNSSPDGIALLVAPLFHVAGLSRLVGQLIVGGISVTMAQFRPAAVLAAIERHAITDITVVPTMLQSLLDDPEFRPERVRSLHRIGFGAAPMPPDLLDRALQACPDTDFLQAYGMTETAGTVCVNLPQNHRPAARSRSRLNAAGRASLGAEIMVADEAGRELPRGEVGEILVRGPMIMQGYWRQPEATAAAMHHGWLRTGDAGRMDADGFLFIVDRLKDMIISGGENVYCAEVEAALRSHPGVAQAAVIGLPDPHWGEAVHAVVVRRPDASGGAAMIDELRAWCRQQLAGYKCPRSIVFTDELPMSAAGKVLKNVLRGAATTERTQPRRQA
jgi:acyl-CoA synthetase (AMP-forming)/AMP-acid ligase II